MPRTGNMGAYMMGDATEFLQRTGPMSPPPNVPVFNLYVAGRKRDIAPFAQPAQTPHNWQAQQNRAHAQPCQHSEKRARTLRYDL